ncbi:hypothetical protein RvY_06880-2 [Ramazzottius varieornatus]|uniref:Uncharacterized protein n=1 Tax=Ramazzottius varieornatus TaxID=947166 RepID=A0A1D1V060_RAMVA|nr:hypothetical protein RvY_06880-2 [Ramazzottius varieornatus]
MLIPCTGGRRCHQRGNQEGALLHQSRQDRRKGWLKEEIATTAFTRSLPPVSPSPYRSEDPIDYFSAVIFNIPCHTSWYKTLERNSVLKKPTNVLCLCKCALLSVHTVKLENNREIKH